jgi:6-O-methylguanine DNA methyltransferase, DNA binding domain
MRKSWKERLENDQGLPVLKPIPQRMRHRHGHGTIVIPAPMEVAKIMCQVPKGRLTTVSRIAESLARAHGVAVACSVTTGIFAWIAAYAADEAAREGKKKVFPYWRVLKAGGELNSK